MRRRSRIVTQLLAALACALIVAALTGCGSSRHATSHAGTGAGSGTGTDRGGASQPSGPQFSSTGAGQLAHGTFPNGDRFSIGSENYSLAGHSYVELTVTTRDSKGYGFTPVQAPGPFRFGDFGECANPSALLIYGVLPDKGVSVTVTGHHHSSGLATTSIPSRLGLDGALLYGVIHTPARIVVKTSSGATVETASLRGASRAVCPTKVGTFSTISTVHASS